MAAPPIGGNWLFDNFDPDDLQGHRILRTIVSTRTKFQQVEILENDALGRFLVLDGKMQSAQSDEFIYHEALVHPAVVACRAPRTALVLGGGEGATAREILRHRGVERVTMVDIDAELVDLCRRHLSAWHQGAFEDPRVELLCRDARDYLRERPGQFDVIVCDVTDPGDGGPAAALYSEEFYVLVARCLAPGGWFASQALAIRFGDSDRLHISIHRALRKVFPLVRSYMEFVPSFDSLWGFVLGARDPEASLPSAGQIDDRLNAPGLAGLRYFDSTSFARLLALPKNLSAALARSA